MEKEIKKIIEKYQSGKIDDDLDESGAGGFWDLSGNIIRRHIGYDEMPIIDNLQDEIYQAFKIIFNL